MRTGVVLFLLLGLAVVMAGGCYHEKQSQMSTSTEACPSCDKEKAPAAQTAAEAKTEKVAEGMMHSVMAFPTGNRQTSVVLLERTAPAEVVVGQPFAYELKATNLTSATVSDVVVTDTCAANFKVASSEPAAAAGEPGQLRWALGDLGPAESRTITVRGSATDVKPVTNCLSCTYGQRACASINVVQPKLQLAVSAPAQVMRCDNIPVRYTVTNDGTGMARGVVVEQALPQGLTTAAGQNRVMVAAGDLGPGQSKTVEVMLKASETGKVDSVARATGQGGLKAEMPLSQVIQQPQLTVQMSGPEKVFLGRSASYKATVTNKGDGEARNAVLEVGAPAGVKVVNVSSGGVPGMGKASWNLGTLAPGQNVTVSLAMDPQTMGTLEATAWAQAACATKATASARTVVQGIPAILLEMVDVTDPVQVGQTTTYLATVTNQGSMAGTNVRLIWQLEDQMELVSAEGATASKAEGTTVLCGPLPSLAPKAQAVWRVVVRAVEPGDVRMKVTLTSDQLTRPVEKTEATNFYK
jgi:uncharacterized repeat protein (TIGR01451 family)